MTSEGRVSSRVVSVCRWCNTDVYFIPDHGWVHEETTSIYCPERIAEPKP